MSENSHEIIEVIDELKSTSEQNDQRFKLLLEEIDSKLENIGEGKEFVLLRNTLTDLKNSLVVKFDEFSSCINKIKEQTAASSEKDLLELLSERLNTGYENLNTNLNTITDNFSSLYDKFKFETDERFTSLKDELIKLSQEISVVKIEFDDLNKNFENSKDDMTSAVIQSVNNLNSELINERNKDFSLINKHTNEIKSAIQEASEMPEIHKKLENNFNNYYSKITEITDIITNFKNEASSAAVDYKQALTEFGNKLDNLNKSFNIISYEISDDLKNEYSQKIDEFRKFLIDNSEKSFAKYEELFNKISTELDILNGTNFSKYLTEISEKSTRTCTVIEKQQKFLEELNLKLDIFAQTNGTEFLEDELLEIKESILAQENLLKNSEEGIKQKAENNFKNIISKIDSLSDTISEQQGYTEKIKENIIETVVSVFSNTDFTEESEDIKGFVEEKTDELNKQILDVKSQLSNINVKDEDISDCAYTLSDVEHDIANLRGAISEVSSATSTAEINQISRNIHNLTSSIDAISKNLTPAEIFQLKHGILKLNDDILSISSRTNKLLLNSDEASKTISDGVEAFSHIAYNLEEQIKEFSNRELVVQIADKIERMLILAENSATSDATVQKVLMFLGEWVDAASETLEGINSKTDEISSVSDTLVEIRKVMPEKTELVDLLEEKFEEQQTRTDRLEAKLNKLTEAVEANNISSVLQKFEKLENILETMNSSVEKLTSYVD